MQDPDRTLSRSPDFSDPAAVETTSGCHPRHIGRYRVEKVLGSGGFGLVYLAHDEKLNRVVAVKVPHPEAAGTPKGADAYLTEARTVAGLDHPNIVPVYDVGATDDHQSFIVSKFIEGRTLSQMLKTERPSFGQTASLIATMAEALHYAHKHGIVHRDVKPGNILLDADGKPYLADFGLALDDENVGQGARLAGTPAYMSPEQARGVSHGVEGRSDIFSLGVILYEMLVGKRPFKGRSTVEMLEQITTFEPRPPRQVDDKIPKELERICLKAISKAPSDRYTTAKDFADDIRQWLAVASEPPSNTPPAPGSVKKRPREVVAKAGLRDHGCSISIAIFLMFVVVLPALTIGAGAVLFLSSLKPAIEKDPGIAMNKDQAVIFDAPPKQKPDPPKGNVIPVGRAIQSWNDKVSITLEKVELRDDKRMRWHFTLLNSSPAAMNLSVTPGNSFVVDNLGQKYNSIDHSIKGSTVLDLPAAQKVNYWIDFHAAASGATSVTANFGAGGLPTVKVVLAADATQAAAKLIPINRQLQSWDEKVAIILESIEIQPEGRMRWRLSFWNKSANKRAACSIAPDISFITDQNGKKFNALVVSHGQSSGYYFAILEGEKISYWIDFDGPLRDSKVLTAHFDGRGDAGRLPQTVTVALPADEKPVDLTGRWVGTLTQDGIAFTLPFEMTLIQNGKEISGKTTLTGKSGMKVAEFTGKLDGASFTFLETKKLNVSPYPGIKGELKAVSGDGKSLTLTGSWEALPGFGKNSGQIRLQRK